MKRSTTSDPAWRWRNETVRAQTNADSETKESPEPEPQKMHQAKEHTARRKRQTEELRTGTVRDVTPSEDSHEKRRSEPAETGDQKHCGSCDVTHGVCSGLTSD
jgi:hypothetical protein